MRIQPLHRVLLLLALGALLVLATPFLYSKGISPRVTAAAGLGLMVLLVVVDLYRGNRAADYRRMKLELERDPAVEAMDRDPAWIAEDTRAVRYANHVMSETFLQSYDRVRIDPPVGGSSTILFLKTGPGITSMQSQPISTAKS